jgi:hypothetical protein
LQKIDAIPAPRHPVRLGWGMNRSLTKPTRIMNDQSSALVISVAVSPRVLEMLRPEVFSAAQSAGDALAALKLMRFHWLLASMDVPDMQPWTLFEHARRTQARLQCALVDNRLTFEEERRIRQAGGAIFSPEDQSLSAAIARSAPPIKSEPAPVPP